MRKLLIVFMFLCLLLPAGAMAQEGLWFNLESGFYRDEIEVEIFCDDPEADIYYTLDGTVPSEDSESSFYYDGAMPLEDRTFEDNELSAIGNVARTPYVPEHNVIKAHVIRAIAIYPNGEQSAVLNGTFFVGIDRAEHYGDAPIISLMLDSEDLFDYETGIYTLGEHFVEWDSQQNGKYEDWQTQGNFSLKGSEWERPVTVQYLPADGSEGFTQDMGLRIKGGISRSFMQKSLRLIAREQYGEKQLKYPVFPGNVRADGTGLVEKYKSITLRNGGNDVENTRLRDPLFQNLAEGMGFMTQANTPCVAFINGEYWGMYTITEEYSDHAIENNYGIANQNVIIIKNGRVEDGVESDIQIYEDMFDFIAENDMTDPANYEKAGQLLDLPGFAQYCAFHLYIHNDDGIFQDNNWQIWRARDPEDNPYGDGKWRFLLFDTENSSDIFGDGRKFVDDNLTDVLLNDGEDLENRHPQLLVNSLYRNEDFRREVIIALCDVRNVNFSGVRAVAMLNEMRPIYELLMRETFLRFGPDWVAKWNLDTHQANKLKQLETYLRGRYDKFPYVLKKVIGYDYPVKAAITINDPSAGQVQVNRSLLPSGEDFSGLYFTEYPITVTAIPAEGRTFKGWEVEGATIDDPSALTAQVTFDYDFTIRAIFE